MRKFVLESPVFNLQSALDAAKFGVNRLELCANFPEGGDTPSGGMLSYLKSTIEIPVFVMIRPRGGDFCYSPEEVSVMKKDIELLGALGADGFVFGVLDESGQVNQEANSVLIKAANGKPCTFHRAFDVCAAPLKALEEIIALGFDRILTSGAKNTVTDGMELIEQLIKTAGDRIIIMPGGGSRPDHVERLKPFSDFREIHASCKTKAVSGNQFINPDVQFSDDPEFFTHHLGIDDHVVKQFLKAFAE